MKDVVTSSQQQYESTAGASITPNPSGTGSGNAGCSGENWGYIFFFLEYSCLLPQYKKRKA